MKTFYSILMTPIRPAIKEQVSVALVLISENRVFFKHSNEKVAFLKKLIPSDAVELLKQYLIGLSKNMIKIQGKLSNENLLIPQPLSEYKHLSEEYFSYLSKYSNNLITFTKPSAIDIEPTEQNFNLLFKKYISDWDIKIQADEQHSIVERLRENFYPKIISKVNFDVDINKIIKEEKKVLKAVLPERINIFGKNDRYVSAQVIDFNKSSNYLKANLSFYMNFINELDGENSHFIIGDQPLKGKEKNYQYWDDVRNFKNIFTYVPFDEVEVLSSYITEHDVKPVFFDNIE